MKHDPVRMQTTNQSNRWKMKFAFERVLSFLPVSFWLIIYVFFLFGFATPQIIFEMKTKSFFCFVLFLNSCYFTVRKVDRLFE
jgi:hypothetical protein